MEKYSCMIVEDEALAAEGLEDYIKQIPFLELKSVCKDAIYAMDILQKSKIDVIFLDINMPRLKGLDFLRTLKNPPQVIITTAYRDYAVEGYELNVVDYLVKPINFNRFLMAVNKLRNQLPQEILFSSSTAVSTDRPFVFINVNKKRIKIHLDEILFIESKKEYISIVTKDKSYLTKFQIGEIEEQLAKNDFLRVHRSFIIARNRIDAFTAIEVEIGGQHIPIGRSYKELVLSQLGEPI